MCCEVPRPFQVSVHGGYFDREECPRCRPRPLPRSTRVPRPTANRAFVPKEHDRRNRPWLSRPSSFTFTEPEPRATRRASRGSFHPVQKESYFLADGLGSAAQPRAQSHPRVVIGSCTTAPRTSSEPGFAITFLCFAHKRQSLAAHPLQTTQTTTGRPLTSPCRRATKKRSGVTRRATMRTFNPRRL